VFIPGLKPPVRDFAPSDDGDPSEVDAFDRLIRKFRNQPPEVRQIQLETSLRNASEDHWPQCGTALRQTGPNAAVADN